MDQTGVNYRISLEDYFSKGIADAEGHAQGFEKTIGGIKTALLEIAGISLGFEFLKGASESFIESEKAAKQLQFAIGTHGGLTKDFNELTEQSEKLQQTGIFNHVAIQQMETSLLHYGISIDKVKGSVVSMLDAAAQMNMTPDELANEITRAAATGRAMRIFSLLGKQAPVLEKAQVMSSTGEEIRNKGAEARNFAKIQAALTEQFAGGMADIMTTDFGKIENAKQRFEAFKESLGKGLTDAFVSILPQIRSFIEHLKEMLHWINENWLQVKSIAVGLASLYTTFKLISASVAVYNAFLIAQKAATVELTFAQYALNAAMDINPIVAIAAAVGVLATAFYHASQAAKELAENELKQNRDKENKWAEDESKDIENLVDSLMKANKALTEHAARKMALQQEGQKYATDTLPGGIPIGEGDTLRTVQPVNIFGNKKNQEEYLSRAQQVTKALEEFNRQDIRSRTNNDALGSELSEPKASKIQNITITLGSISQDVKIYTTEATVGIDDFMSRLSNALNSLVSDATLIGAE